MHGLRLSVLFRPLLREERNYHKYSDSPLSLVDETEDFWESLV